MSALEDFSFLAFLIPGIYNKMLIMMKRNL
jgi:hypothetical protein